MSFQLIVVTGASRGFGRAAALSFATTIKTPLHFVLAGRDEAELIATRQLIVDGSNLRGDSLIIDVVVSDLGRGEGLKDVADTLFSAPTSTSSPRTYFKVIFINNAGSLGPLSPIGVRPGVDLLADMTSAFALNVTSSCYLTSSLMERCAGGSYATRGVQKVVIVNVSSLAAVQAFGSWGIYCAGKAAREMFHKCLAEEVNKRGELLPKVFVLNYAPGPLDTNMQQEIREGPSVDKETQDFYRGMKEKNQLVDAGDSARKLARIILFEKFSTGEHLDYYDSVIGVDTSAGETSCCGCVSCDCGVDCQCKAMNAKLCDSCSK